jgi:hypothetical protein
MPSKPDKEHGVLAKLRGRLRGDRYMVDAYPVVPEPAPAPAAAPVAAAAPAAEKE